MTDPAQRRKRLLLLSIAATAVAYGLLLPADPGARAMILLAEVPSLMAWALFYAWYKTDVLQRRTSTSTAFNGLVILLGWIAVPGYFFRTRGALRGALSTLVFYASVVAWSLLAALTAALRQALAAA